MKKFTHVFLFFLLGVILFQFASCSEDTDCSQTARKNMLCNFYKSSKTAVKDTLDSLTVTAYGTDSVLINKEAKVTTAQIPLRFTADSTILVFHYANAKLRDTLIVYHTNTPNFISMECGFSMAQSISKVKYTKTLIDSVAITYKLLNLDDIQNIKIFY